MLNQHPSETYYRDLAKWLLAHDLGPDIFDQVHRENVREHARICQHRRELLNARIDRAIRRRGDRLTELLELARTRRQQAGAV